MKIYKFRSLATQTDLERAQVTIETGHFWCSRFTDLNDPMEGVFTLENNSNVKRTIKNIFSEKNNRRICSFSGDKGFSCPPMWGYYANGFKGIAIEVTLKKKDNIYKMEYIRQQNLLNARTNDANRILTRKLLAWKHEDEYRFIKETINNYNQIGKITKVYFGDPYGNVFNKDDIKKQSASLKSFHELKDKLLPIVQAKGIDAYRVRIQNDLVIEGRRL